MGDTTKLDDVLDFEDNVKSVCLRIELDNCEQVKEEISNLNQWREEYNELFNAEKINQSLTEPPLSQARALLKRANKLKLSDLCTEVIELKDKVDHAETWIEKLS